MALMLASMIGETGNSRLPKDKQFVLSPLVPDQGDSPKGAYFKTPPLRRGWKDALMSGKATLRQLLDLSGDEYGRILSTAYPDLGDIPVRLDPKSKSNAYLPKTTLAARDFTYAFNGKEFTGHLAPQVLPESVTLTQSDEDAVWTGLIHEALTHGVAEREGWSPDFKGTNIEAQGGDYDKYLRQAGERLSQAHVLYEILPEMRAYSFPELVERLNGDRGENPGPRSPPLATEAKLPPREEHGAEAPPPSTERAVRQDAEGGDAGLGAAVSETPVSETPRNPGGPRIVVNPQVFRDKRDALCVAFNEAFRVVMETNGFEPVSEPTEAQRKFFAETAYANDELQLRRTILARIATLDTSVSDPTDEQLEETMEMLEMVMEVGAPQNEWEQQAVQRLHDVVAKSLESTRANGTAQQPEPPKEEGSAQAAVGGGETLGGVDDEEEAELRRLSEMADRQAAEEREAKQFMEERGMDTSATIPTMAEAMKAHEAQVNGASPAEPAAQEPEKPGDAGTSSPNWANGAVVEKDNASKFGEPEKPGDAGTSSPNWANGAIVGENDAAKFGEEQPPAEAIVAGNEALPSPTEAGNGLFTVKPGGRYFDMQGRVITKRAAERMLRKRRREA